LPSGPATADRLTKADYDVVLEAVGGLSSEAILLAVNAVAPIGFGVYPRMWLLAYRFVPS